MSERTSQPVIGLEAVELWVRRNLDNTSQEAGGVQPEYFADADLHAKSVGMTTEDFLEQAKIRTKSLGEFALSLGDSGFTDGYHMYLAPINSRSSDQHP